MPEEAASRPGLAAALSIAVPLLAACTQVPVVHDSARMATSATASTGAALDVIRPVRGCADLRGVELAGIGGTGSRVVTTTETLTSGVAVCAVEGRLAPSIGFKLMLPVQTWTQRYLQVGCGGVCGRISLEVGAAEGCAPLDAGGFAIASTDMGHQGTSGDFGLDIQQRADFAHRAVHLTAQASKKLIQAFYGRPQAYAYFSGCSDGGREALVEAQRYPQDFDGIIAGAPALNFQAQNGLYHAWQARSNQGAEGRAILVASRLPLLHRAVLDRCDKLDGQADGLIAEPRACDFDPAVLQCPASAGPEDPGCLSATEVEAVRRLYGGPRDPATGERLTIGGPQPGSELGWAGVFVPARADQPIFSERIALEALRTLVFEEELPRDFRLADMRFDRTVFDQLRSRHPLFDATNPDLSDFAAKGGKLIMWHGWSDPHISPLNTIAYHEAVRARMGEQRAEAFERLYLLPGVHHCAGGEGPSVIDVLTPMLAWVEQGIAPQAIVARQADATQAASRFGQPTAALPVETQAAPAVSRAPAPMRSRPVYPYPAIAAYDGKGDANQATSYRPAMSRVFYDTPRWAGTDFFNPYTPRQR